MHRISPLILMLMFALPASSATQVFADPRGYQSGDDLRGDGHSYGDQDDGADGPTDRYGQYGDSDGDDDDGAYGPDDEFSPDDPSDGMRT